MDCPAFQRSQISFFSVGESLVRFRSIIHTTLQHNRWCCIDLLNAPALEEPVHALHCQRILAAPNKRHVRKPIEFLNREEIDALLSIPNRSTWVGRRNRTLLLVAVQTGLRVSDLLG